MSTNNIGFEPRPLPWFFRGANFLAETLKVHAPSLTPENILKAASRQASLPADFPPYLETALDVLCRSLVDDACLHWFGRMNYWNMLVTGLSGFLQVEQTFKQDPALGDTPLLDPVIVVGFPRSGTTFLHRLLSALDGAQGIEMYRYIYPMPTHPDLRQLRTSAIFEPWKIASRIYNMDAIHYMRPHLPDECNFGLRMTLHSMLFWSMAPAYGYLDWLLDQDCREAYQFYRKLIVLYQHQLPGQRLTLKCPYHVAWLPALAQVFPEAHIVQTHRDPLETIASDCKLTASLQGLATNVLDWRRIVQYVYQKTLCFAQRSVAFAKAAPESLIFHLPYSRLIKEPESLMRQALDFWGMSYSVPDAQALRQHLTNNRQHKYGQHTYSLEQFDLSPDKITHDFKEYREMFLIP